MEAIQKVPLSELRLNSWYSFSRDSSVNAPLNKTKLEKIFRGDLKAEPIPITEIWLKRLGFPSDLSTVDAGGNYTIAFERQGDKLVLLTSYMDEVLKEFKYVHEYQNTFYALRGEEVELDHEE